MAHSCWMLRRPYLLHAWQHSIQLKIPHGPGVSIRCEQVDTENETMRMKEGWEVWLLPNQATGKQGVPRYIKVDPAAVSEDPAAGALDGALEQVGAISIAT